MTDPVVLIVDDDDALREILSELVAEAGFSVRTAPDGAVALDVLSEIRAAPVLMLLDRMMPVMDGIAVIDRLRATGELPLENILLFTASREATPDDVRVLHKPVAGDALIAAIRAQCARLR